MTSMYDEEDYINQDPNAEHDEWEQAIKDDGTLVPVNERYRVRQSALDWPRVWCGTCDIPLPHIHTVELAVLLEAAKEHEATVHPETTEEVVP